MSQEQLEKIEKIVNENSRALRGHNGVPGLVGEVELLKKDITTIVENTNKLNDSLSSWKTAHSGRLTALETSHALFQAECTAARKIMSEQQNAAMDKLVGKQSVLDLLKSLLIPVIVAVVTAGVMGVLF